MKWCVTFPEETVLVVRPSLAAICLDNKPAGKLLGALLYRYSIRKEHQTEAENINEAKAAQGQKPDQDTTFRIYRTQAHLVEDMCGEITEKTLHDVAVPTLQLLGYLDIEEMPGRNCYDLHLEPITQALSLYSPNSHEQPALQKFLVSQLQLEKFLIRFEDLQIMPNDLEEFLIDKKFFLFLLEKVLIANRNFSHCKRGRKARTEATSDGNSEKPQIRTKIGSKKSKKEVSVTASTSPDETAVPPAHTHSFSSSQEKTPLGESDEQPTRSDRRDDTDGIPDDGRPALIHPSRPATDTQRTAPAQSPRRVARPVSPDARTGTTGTVKPSEHSAEAEAIRALYDSIALGPGKLSGHPKWDWTALEEMVAAHPTEEEIRLVYTHLKSQQKKCSVQAVWENWTLLASLKKPVFVQSASPRQIIVDEEPDRPFLKPSDTHKPRYGALAAVGGGR